MAEAKESKVDEANNSKENNENPPDLLQRFAQEKTPKETQLSNPQEPEQPDLNLKLSLGGIYNEINTTKEKPLTRSSSTIGVITLNKESSDTPLPSSFLSLSRSCSLPVETQQGPKEGNVEELQAVNVKELLAAKRVEAIKKLMEKQRSVRGTKEKEKSPLPENPSSSPSKVVAWAASNVIKSRAFCRAIVKIKEDNENFEGLKESDAIKGSGSSKSSSEPKDSDPAVTSGTKANGKSVKPAETKLENPSKKAKVSNGSMECNGIDVMKQMPSVSTVGDGPNGRKVEGFLYRYMKGQVCIVCICHGRFLSPAEFVKHAGGKDVENPMKHISVCPTSFSH